MDFLTGLVGRAGAIGAVIVVAAARRRVLVLMTLSVLRLTRLVVRHRTAATRTVAGARGRLGRLRRRSACRSSRASRSPPGARPRSPTTARCRCARACRTRRRSPREAAVDAFRDTPGDQLLTGLRGKDVLVAFVESYGRDAVEDPEFAPQVGAVLDAGNRRLRAAGFAARSAFLTSPTAGGGSWLAHATFLSGLWINNQQRYRTLVASDRLTLNSAFRRAGWRTVGVMPGITRAWPEGAFFGYDQRLRLRDNLGYRGPRFSFASMPDQYTLAAFERTELAKPGRGPVMAEIPLVSSHAPWTPIPELIDWDDVGDGSVFDGMAGSGGGPDDVSADATRARAAYRRVHRVLAEHPHLLRGDLRRRRPRARLPRRPPARPARHRRRAPAGTCRSRSSPATRPSLDRISGVGLAGRPEARPAGPGLADGRLPRPVPDRLRRIDAFGG